MVGARALLLVRTERRLGDLHHVHVPRDALGLGSTKVRGGVRGVLAWECEVGCRRRDLHSRPPIIRPSTHAYLRLQVCHPGRRQAVRDAYVHAARLEHTTRLGHHLRHKVKVILTTKLRIEQSLLG